MKNLILGLCFIFGIEVSIARSLFVSSEKRVSDCGLDRDQQQALLNETQKMALKSAQEACSLGSIVKQTDSLRPIISQYAEYGCIGTVALVRLEFTCRVDWFFAKGVSIEGSYALAQKNALEKAKKLCERNVERVSEWIDDSRGVNYWFEYRARARFKCL